MPGTPSSELPCEAHVPVEEVGDVVDAVLEHRHAVDAPAEGEAGVLLAVVLHVAEDFRIDHAGAADLDPAGLLARAAALAAAEHAGEIDLRRRLGEREERRPQAHADLLAEEAP